MLEFVCKQDWSTLSNTMLNPYQATFEWNVFTEFNDNCLFAAHSRTSLTISNASSMWWMKLRIVSSSHEPASNVIHYNCEIKLSSGWCCLNWNDAKMCLPSLKSIGLTH